MLAAHLPDYDVYDDESVVLLGEGLENLAYIVNGELIVRFSKASDPHARAARVDKEAGVLTMVAAVAPLPVPIPAFAVPEGGCLAYVKVPGVPLRDLPPTRRLAQAASIGVALGEFLSVLHSLPLDQMANLVQVDDDPLEQWRNDAAKLYQQVKAHVPPTYRAAIEAFLRAAPVARGDKRVFSHNDLGMEHVLVDPVTWTITGVIDWSDAAIDDPAYDFGLIYRDLGPQALDAALGSYRPDGESPDALRHRAIFYARCSVFEDLDYGLDKRLAGFVDTSLAALEWLFP